MHVPSSDGILQYCGPHSIASESGSEKETNRKGMIQSNDQPDEEEGEESAEENLELIKDS